MKINFGNLRRTAGTLACATAILLGASGATFAQNPWRNMRRHELHERQREERRDFRERRQEERFAFNQRNRSERLALRNRTYSTNNYWNRRHVFNNNGQRVFVTNGQRVYVNNGRRRYIRRY
jgi:hypothetical protein